MECKEYGFFVCFSIGQISRFLGDGKSVFSHFWSFNVFHFLTLILKNLLFYHFCFLYQFASLIAQKIFVFFILLNELNGITTFFCENLVPHRNGRASLTRSGISPHRRYGYTFTLFILWLSKIQYFHIPFGLSLLEEGAKILVYFLLKIIFVPVWGVVEVPQPRKLWILAKKSVFSLQKSFSRFREGIFSHETKGS